MAPSARLERATTNFAGWYSLQLNYEGIFNWLAGQVSNLDSPESKSGMLPITPPAIRNSRGRTRTSGLHVQSVGCCHCTTREQTRRSKGLEPPSSDYGSPGRSR